MDTPERPHSAESDADTDQATNVSGDSAPPGSLILEDIGSDSEGGQTFQRKGRIGVLFYLALAWLVIIVVCAIFADLLPVSDPNAIDVVNKESAPGENGYILGSDGLGRDILSRIVYGARVSVTISVTAVIAGSVIGGILGLAAGYIRGKFEGVIMGFVNTLLAFPGLILLLTLVAFVGQNLGAVTAAVAFLSIPTYTRVSRATTLAVSQREFVLAANAMGAKRNRILFKEIAPNVLMPVMAFGLIALGTVIVLEGTLAFLGLSVQPPTPTWGSMINEGRSKIGSGVYHLTITPSLVLFFTVFSLNYVGDSLRNRFDVREAQL